MKPAILDAISHLEQARLAFKLAGQRSLMATCDEMISEARDEIRALESEDRLRRLVELTEKRIH